MNLIGWLPRFRRVQHVLPVLAERETWDRDTIAAYQLERLNALWSHARLHVPFYQRLQRELEIPPQFASVAQFQQCVPALDKQTLKLWPREFFLSRRCEQGVWRRTSGSTGVPLEIFSSHRDHQRMLAFKYRLYAQWGLGLGDRIAFLWSSREGPPRASTAEILKERLQDRARNRLRLPAKHLGKQDLEKHLKRMAAFRPAGLYAFSSAADLLAREALESGFVCSSLRAVILSGEPVLPPIRRTVERAFGSPVVIEYGCTECSLIAGSAPDHTLRVREDACILETLPLESGAYEIVLTVLENHSFPLIRYRVGDVTDAPLVVPDRGFGILHNVMGRRDDVVYMRSGRCLHPTIIDEVFESPDFNLVRKYRVHQSQSGNVNVQLEWSGAADHRVLLNLAARLEHVFGGWRIELNVVDLIPQSAAGKHRAITSEFGSRQSAASSTFPTTAEGALFQG